MSGPRFVFRLEIFLGDQTGPERTRVRTRALRLRWILRGMASWHGFWAGPY